ncbi:MAG: DUF2796 domain-containing protein [Pseudomonadota bacterium]
MTIRAVLTLAVSTLALNSAAASAQHEHGHDHGHDHDHPAGSVSLGAHVHGLAQLDVAADREGLLEAILMSAAYNLVGFERAPNNAEEAALVAEAHTALSGGALLAFNGEASCELVATNIEGGPSTEFAGEDHHHDDDHTHDHAHGHSDNGHSHGEADFVITWTYDCASPAQLDTIEAAGLLSAFPAIETLELTYFDGEVAAADTLDAGSTRLSWR